MGFWECVCWGWGGGDEAGGGGGAFFYFLLYSEIMMRISVSLTLQSSPERLYLIMTNNPAVLTRETPLHSKRRPKAALGLRYASTFTNK